MPLSAGDKLGPYEILAPLGAGGMGEVYRAKDTKLDREVAIKVLPAALARDPERLARFEREAKILASLNHPNIAQIYGIEESSSGRALVMELVPGQTLQTPLPQAQALRIAVQITEALDAAHEKAQHFTQHACAGIPNSAKSPRTASRSARSSNRENLSASHQQILVIVQRSGSLPRKRHDSLG